MQMLVTLQEKPAHIEISKAKQLITKHIQVDERVKSEEKMFGRRCLGGTDLLQQLHLAQLSRKQHKVLKVLKKGQIQLIKSICC